MEHFDQFLLSVVYDIPCLIFVVDPVTGLIIYANQHMKELVGDACIGRTFIEQFPGAGARCCFVSYVYGNPISTDLEKALENQCEFYDDDSENWYHVHQRSIEWLDGSQKIVIAMSEINALKRMQKSLSEAHAELALRHRALEVAANTDRLTQLYNRQYLDSIIEKEFARATRYQTAFSLILIDCDHFKTVNDTHGHQVGDLVLGELAQLLRESVRASDIVGRWGGEEFLLVLPDTGIASAARLSEKLRCAIDSHEFSVVLHKTASFGVTLLRPNETIKEFISRVDQALYRAKQNGRNRVEVVE